MDYHWVLEAGETGGFAWGAAWVELGSDLDGWRRRERVGERWRGKDSQFSDEGKRLRLAYLVHASNVFGGRGRKDV